MHLPTPTRRPRRLIAGVAPILLGLGFAAAGLCLAQSSGLPATQPTQLPIAAPASISAPTPAPAAQANPSHPAKVDYADGRLKVTADNSSLNQILREISRKTGMKITGGVGDERVFGIYGPGPPAEILASLLNGTGSNMLLRESSTDAPSELILTPRGGGPTPPNPNAPGMDDDELAQPAVSPPQSTTPVSMQSGTSPVSGSATGAASGSSSAPPNQLPLAFGLDGAASTVTATPSTTDTTPQSTGDTVPQSPNGVKTPRQIYQQLQQLQQQQPANTPQ